MQCSTKGLCLPAAVLVAGCLAAGCGSTAQSAISNLPSKTATVTATPSVTRTASPGVTSTVTATVTAASAATATVTATAAPSTPVTTPAATTSPTAAATGSGSGTSLLWLWILLGAVVLAGLIALIVHSAREMLETCGCAGKGVYLPGSSLEVLKQGRRANAGREGTPGAHDNP